MSKNNIRFTDLVAKGFASPYLHKEAQLNADDTQFEQDFSKLAFLFVQDRAQALMKYMLGFETVQRDPDGSRAVGMFGFKVGKDYYYIPAFFLNNQVKGVDMILNKKTNTFIPLTEEWINYILNRQTIELGEGRQNADELAGDFENPNFDFLQRPTVGPLGGPKFASAEDDSGWTLKEAWDHTKETIRDMAKNDHSFNEAWSGFVCACANKPFSFSKKAEAGELLKYITEIGGPQAVGSIFNTITSSVKTANAALTFYKSASAFLPEHFAKNCYLVKKAQEEQAKVDVKVTDTPSKKEEENREVIEDGFRIIDRRPKNQKSEVYESDFDKRINTPDKSGLYEVLMPDGSFEEACILFKNRICGGRDDDFDTLVFIPSQKKYVFERNNKIFVKDTAIGTIKDVYAKAEALSSIPTDSKIIFIGPNGTCVGPFEVNTVSHDSGDLVRIHGWWQGSICSQGEHIWSIRDAVLANFEGNPKVCGNSVQIPSDWRFFEIKKDASGVEQVMIGNDSTLSTALMKSAFHRLELGSDNGDTFYAVFDNSYPTEEVNFKQASINLVTRLGIDAKEAKHLLKRAASEKKIRCTIKLAQAPMVGVSMGGMQEQTPEADPYTGIPVYQTPYEDETTGQFTGVPSDGNPNQQGENVGGEMERNSGAAYGTEPAVDEEAKQLMQQAGDLGQKEVFDHAAIGGLSKVYDTSAVIDSYLPGFTETIDRLGRILFLYYWKHDDFVSRYGTDDVIEMEDLLRGVFKSLGKLTLDLKQKAIGSEDADTVSV